MTEVYALDDVSVVVEYSADVFGVYSVGEVGVVVVAFVFISGVDFLRYKYRGIRLVLFV